MRAARLAVTLLTVLPVRGPEHVDRRTAGRAMALAPAVGVGLGMAGVAVMLAVAALVVGGSAPSAGLLPPVGGIATLALLTRGLHLDGLADLADGLGASRDRQRSLAVMKQSDIGAFGVATMLFVVLGQVAALSAAATQHRAAVTLVVAAVAGRLAVPLACRRGIPAARPGGLGALVAGGVSPAAFGCAAGSVLACAAVAGYADGGWPEACSAVLAVVAATGVAAVATRRLVRRLGGITGDVLGGLVEVTSLVALIVMVIHVPWPVRHALG
jgi:adenosylcobinamide-GDP ribazoletransferase